MSSSASSSTPQQLFLCYICDVGHGTVAIQDTNIIAQVEKISRQTIETDATNLICIDCANLFAKKDILKREKLAIEEKANILMKEKVDRMKTGFVSSRGIKPGTTSSSEIGWTFLCYLCDDNEGTIAVKDTNIITLLEPIRQRAIKTIETDLVCRGCVDLFMEMDNLKCQYEAVNDKATTLMKGKVERLKAGSGGSKIVPKAPRFNCKSCDFKTFNLEEFPSHNCTGTEKLFTVDFLRDDFGKEASFQLLLDEPADSLELKNIVIIDGQMHEARAFDGQHNKIESEEDIARMLKDPTKPKFLLSMPSSDDED